MQHHVAVSIVHAFCKRQTVVESTLNFEKEGIDCGHDRERKCKKVRVGKQQLRAQQTDKQHYFGLCVLLVLYTTPN